MRVNTYRTGSLSSGSVDNSQRNTTLFLQGQDIFEQSIGWYGKLVLVPKVLHYLGATISTWPHHRLTCKHYIFFQLTTNAAYIFGTYGLTSG
jgi:hypothetical protein